MMKVILIIELLAFSLVGFTVVVFSVNDHGVIEHDNDLNQDESIEPIWSSPPFSATEYVNDPTQNKDDGALWLQPYFGPPNPGTIKVTNRNAFDWKNTRIYLNDQFVCEYGRIKAGGTADIDFSRFTSHGGIRFNPQSLAVQDIVIEADSDFGSARWEGEYTHD
ncbi:MAG: hypothetical protein KC964_31575 [Candidatus Omnitrophica bacterium]|nr:hypothetical protein [Candidatus Omnitrophota bacterium]